MKPILLILVITLTAFSCKKIRDDIQEKKVLEYITESQWKITSFKQENVDQTKDFVLYRFQFKSNETVDAIKNGSLEKTGIWKGDISNYSIYTNFSQALYPIQLLNATWTITNGTEEYITAESNVNDEKRTLRLEKSY